MPFMKPQTMSHLNRVILLNFNELKLCGLSHRNELWDQLDKTS